MQREDVNRSLDLSELLSRVSRQAVLQGGPYSGRLAPIPVLAGQEYPRFLCQPGFGYDATMYHYVWVYRNIYVYFDHCSTVGQEAHQMDCPPVGFVDTPKGNWARAGVLVAALLASVMISGSAIFAVLAVIW